MDIGGRIKEMRLERGLTQEELADRCELSKGFISQLENSLVEPAISTLEDILVALGSGLKEFFSDYKTEDKIVFTDNDYFEKVTHDSRIKWLVPNAQKNEMEPIHITLAPAASTEEDMPHEGEEFGYVMRGQVELRRGKKSYKLNAGDTFYFTSDRPHQICNIGNCDAEILWITSPPNF